MTYGRGCGEAGIGCSRLLRFSNPDQTYLGDPMGVAADADATGSAGPADARLTINNTARWVGSFRSQACTDFTVPTQTQIAPLGGGKISIQVNAAPGCLWEAESQSHFIGIASGAPGAGPGSVTIAIEANPADSERSGTLTVAGQAITVRQLATSQGICGRSTAVMGWIAREAGFAGAAECGQVTDAHLARIGRLFFSLQGVRTLKVGDFAGLTSLTILGLESIDLDELPEGLFAGLTSLKFLNLGYNRLTELPAGVFSGLTSLERLRLTSNDLSRLPAGVFDGLSNLKELELDYNDLTSLPQGVFGDLFNLEELLLNSNELAEYPAGTFAGLSRLKKLNLNSNRATELPIGLFADLSSLEELGLLFNYINDLPESIFSGLSNLKDLNLGRGQFTTLPTGVFAGLSRLEKLSFWDGQLTTLPSGVFSGLSSLQELNLYSNHLGELPAGLFTGLSSLERLVLGDNRIDRLPVGIFSGLASLNELNLFRNQLSSLPEGVFSGLTSVEELHLGSNRVEPLPLAVLLEEVGTSQFRATISEGAPFALELPVSVGSVGEIEGAADSVTIPAGMMASAPLRVTRVAGTRDPIDADFGNLPALPSSHSGYSLAKDSRLPLRILASSLAADAALIDLSSSKGTLDPAFDKGTTSYTAHVEHDVSSVTITPTTSNADATVAYLDGSDKTLADADTNADGQQLDLEVGRNTIRVLVTASDTTTARTYTLVVIRDASLNICGRNAQVRDSILSASGVSDCADVTEAQLAAITELRIRNAGITSLKSSDFVGLTALASLNLWGNELTTLPVDVFSGLAELEDLTLASNHLSDLPVGIFSGLKSLNNLHMYGNRLVGLRREHFAGLDSLTRLNLANNGLVTLPAGFFGELTGLRSLSLFDNRFRSLPPELFSGLSSLRQLLLQRNRITELPAGIFSGQPQMEHLYLQENNLSRLPDGLFEGMTKLFVVDMRSNVVDPLPLPLSLEPFAQNQFKLVSPTGAPLALNVPVTVSSAGEIAGGATSVTIPKGATESAPVTVTRKSGTTDLITVDFDSNLDLNPSFRGLFFERDDRLPKEIIAATAPTRDGALRSLSVSPGALDVSFDPATTNYSVRVSNAVSSVTLSPTTSSTGATVSFLDASDATLTDVDAATDGYQASLEVGDNTIKVQVTAEDTTTTRTYTLVVTRNSAPVITTASAVSVQENAAEVAVLAATDSDGDDITWLTNGGADAALFDLTPEGILTFASAPDFEDPDDLNADNEYVVIVEASDGLDVSYMTLTATVTDEVNERSVSDDASLSALGLSDGTLNPVFAANTSDYSARVAAAVTSITVTPTLGDSDATIEYLDQDDQALADADDSTDGQQVDLNSGENTARLRVTATDGTTTRIYMLVVTRNRAPEITTTSPVIVEENQTAVATLKATDGDGDDLSWSVNGGADAGRFDLTEAGGLTFSTPPDFESPSDADINNEYVVEVRATDGIDTIDLTLTVQVTDVDDGLSDVASLSGLSLSVGTLDPAFASGTTIYAASVANSVSSITVTPATSDAGATLTYLDADDGELDDADGNAAGQQANLGVGENTIKVRVTAEDTTTTRTYTIVVTRHTATDVCERTAQIRDAIVAAISGVDDCKDVTSTQLSGITGLDVSNESIASLQSGDFDGLTGLELLKMNGNTLTRLRSDAFSGLTSLDTLELAGNRLGSLPSSVFSDQTSLKVLLLGGNRLNSLSSNLFSGPGNLQELELQDNLLTELPDGLFLGLGSLTNLDLSGNSVDPLLLPVSLAKVGSSEFKAVASAGAPFGLVLPVSASSAGEIAGGASTVTVSAGEEESATVEVTRVSGTSAAVTVDIGALPSLPAGHQGYALARDTDLPVEVLPVVLSKDAELSALALSDGVLDPEFSTGTTSYAATVANGVSSITVTPTLSDSDATLAYRDADDGTLADADTGTEGQQVDLEVGENTIKVRVTAADTTTTQTYTIVVTREDAPVVSGGVCDRTEQVRDAIVAAVSGVGDCADVTESHLSAITSLNLSGEGIGSLQSGDFEGLTGLVQLVLEDNDLTALPSDLLDGLSALESLNFKDNELSALPSGVFDDLGSLSALYLGGNRLSAVPAEVISGLNALEILGLADNQLGALGSNDFSGLGSLEVLFLGDNRLSSLPAGVFSGLSALQELWLGDNQLTSLPDGVFSGLNALAVLSLSGNSTDPLLISVSLENVGSSEFKAVAPVGAPFDLSLPVSASGDGGIEGDADTVTVSTGAVESSAVGVTRAHGTTGAVTVDIGTLPALPANHRGYALEKDASLPLAIPSPTESEPVASNDATLSRLSLSDGTLDPVFASGTTSYAATVANGVSLLTVTPTSTDADASLRYLDASEQLKEDADTTADGHQVELDLGENTIKVEVKSADGTTTEIYTVVITRNRVPSITTSSPLSVEENKAVVATLAATDADGDDIGWSTNGGEDESQFDLTEGGALTFATAPDYETPSDADEDNAYVVVVRASDGTDTAELTLTVQVTDVEEASSDATLGSLSLSDGTLDPVFASGTTSYAATVANGVSSITVTPTLSDSDATLAYRDADDGTLADADTGTEGQQVDLEVGENTIKVRVTAADTTTTQTYTIVVTREDAPVVSGGVCDRTEQVRDAIVAAVSGVGDCADVTESHLSAITSLNLSGEGIGSLQSGDFEGLTGLVQLVLEDNDLTALPSDLLDGLSALESLNFKDNELSALPSGCSMIWGRCLRCIWGAIA